MHLQKRLLVLLCLSAVCSQASAVNLVVTNQTLTFFDATYNRVDESGNLDPNGTEVNYHTLDFYVTQNGLYDLEMAVPTAQGHWDTYFFLYAPGLNPSDATQNFLAGKDDSTDALTILSGSYHSGNQGRSRLGQMSLIANTQYQVVMTSFDFASTFIDDVHYDIAIGNGPGDAIAGAPVPEPASLAVLGLGALAIARRRRSRR